MQKFIPYAKLSKKAKRAANNARRATWGDMNPVTRTSANPRAYNRAKNRRQNPSSDFDAGFFVGFSHLPAQVQAFFRTKFIVVAIFVLQSVEVPLYFGA